MSRLGMICAGLVLLAAVGCFNDSFLAHPFSAGRYRQVVDGKPGPVSAALEAGFSGVGVTMFVKRQGEEVRLAGQTKSGQVFCVYVRPGKSGASATSVVTVKWDGQPDEPLWLSIQGWLATSSPEKDGSPKGA
jgi:hypothetical protein